MPLGPDAKRRPAKRRPGPLLATALAAALGLALASSAAEPGPAKGPVADRALAEKLSHPGDLTLNDAPLGESLLRISEIWGVNLIAGVELKGRVTGAYRNVPLYEILDSILLSNGYSYRPVGSSLVVLKFEDVGNVNPMFQTAAIPLRFAEPKECVESVKLLSSPRGKVQAIESARVLLVSDFPEQVTTIRRFVEEMDAAAGHVKSAGPGKSPGGLQVAQFKPQYAKAEALKESVQAVLTQTGKLGVVPLENRIVVADLAANLDLVRKVVEELDVPRPQVRITALIYDVALKDMEQLGINWNQALKFRHDSGGNPQTLLDLDAVTATVPAAGTPDGILTITNLSKNIDLTAVVQALQQASDSRLLADPNVTVIENEKATIGIVTEIPYQQLTQTQQGGNIGTTAFREAGVKLEVTPRIAEDGTIQMLVTPSFSRLAGYTTGEQPQPIIDRREAATTVRVANCQTFVIGGLRQRSDTGEYSGIPFLKDIKWLGALFRSRQTTIRESELLVFIRPEIVLPDQALLPREQAAWQLGTSMLDQIPAAQPCQLPAGDPSSTCVVRRLPAIDREFDPAGQPLAPGANPSASRGPSPSATAASVSKEPTTREKFFGSPQHPDGWLMEQKPMRQPYSDRYRGGSPTGPSGATETAGRTSTLR